MDKGKDPEVDFHSLIRQVKEMEKYFKGKQVLDPATSTSTSVNIVHYHDFACSSILAEPCFSFLDYVNSSS